MNGVYTDTMTAQKAPDGFCAVTGKEVVHSVRKIKQGSAIDEALHRQEAAQGMLNLQNAPQKRE